MYGLIEKKWPEKENVRTPEVVGWAEKWSSKIEKWVEECHKLTVWFADFRDDDRIRNDMFREFIHVYMLDGMEAAALEANHIVDSNDLGGEHYLAWVSKILKAANEKRRGIRDLLPLLS